MNNKFEDVFFDARTHEPKPGQIVVCYNNSVELLDCPFKNKVIQALHTHGAAANAVNLLTKVGKASSLGAYYLCKEMANDLLLGDIDAVRNKPYKYIVQLFFYTLPENFPEDDPHWSFICTIPNSDDI